MQNNKPVAVAEPTREELLARIAELEKNASQSRVAGRLTLRIGEKGGVMVIGLQRFPVTLYAEQWERLLNEGKTILEFIAANKANLATKAQKPVA